ncbi:MAG: Crp/Fnr family transcriptional regulator [Blastocatellia bacterium]
MPLTTDPNTLAQKTLFQQLPPDQLAVINGLLHQKTFPTNATLITAEQPGEAVYLIERGAVKIHIEQADGTDVILAILAAGDVLGEMSMTDAATRSANATTLEDTVLWWMERAAFQRCLQTMPQLALNLLRLLSQRLRMANEQIQALATKDVEGRVARQLLALVQAYGQQTNEKDWCIPIRLTQSELASLVGATRERVSQVIASYKQRRYLSVDKHHHITVHRLDALTMRVQSNG